MAFIARNHFFVCKPPKIDFSKKFPEIFFGAKTTSKKGSQLIFNTCYFSGHTPNPYTVKAIGGRGLTSMPSDVPPRQSTTATTL